jgi:outer membrane lipoprotein-sorting protein
LKKIESASADAQTMSADFSYAVTSLRQQQLITGKVIMMKPNFMRITYDYMAQPAFPNPVVSDGEKIYTFKPQHGRTWDPVLGARQASGLAAGGGKYGSDPAAADGSNLRLWDSIAIQAFFNPDAALHYLYYQQLGELKTEMTNNINGVTYDVIQHHYTNGNIAGGESSSFEQHLYVNPEGLIAIYDLEFSSHGRPGVQIMRLSNIQTNVPLTKADFVFTPPAEAVAAK